MKVEHVSCDNQCGNTAITSWGAPDGWVKIYGGRPSLHLDFCTWDCCTLYFIAKSSTVDVVVIENGKS